MTSLIQRRNILPLAHWPFGIWGDFERFRPTISAPAKLGVDVVRNDNGYLIEASLPGFDVDDIEVTVDRGVLRISAEHQEDETKEPGKYVVRERYAGKFQRALRIPESVDVDTATTAYKDGVLTVELPVRETDQPHRLPVAA